MNEKLNADLDRQREIVEDIKASRLRPGQASALLDPQQRAAEPKAAEVDFIRLAQTIETIDASDATTSDVSMS